MTYRGNANLTEVLGGKILQRLEVDVVLGERIVVAFQPEAFEEDFDIVHRQDVSL